MTRYQSLTLHFISSVTSISMSSHLILSVVTILLFGALARCHSTELDQHWKEWTLKFGKSYKSVEEANVRREIWEHRWRYVQDHNSRDDVTFSLQVNQFADKVSSRRKTIVRPSFLQPHEHEQAEPASWDWRDKHVVTPVEDEGMIGRVAAYVTSESVESFHAIHTGTLFHLSAQEVADCCEPFATTEFDCVKKTGGLCTAVTYINGTGKCNNETCKAVATDLGTGHVTTGSEAALKTAVLITPVFASIDASLPSFEMYHRGVYEDPACSTTRLDHAVQVVGYGAISERVEYWICRNSWGKNWGMDGYILIRRNKSNVCGIASLAVYPI